VQVALRPHHSTLIEQKTFYIAQMNWNDIVLNSLLIYKIIDYNLPLAPVQGIQCVTERRYP